MNYKKSLSAFVVSISLLSGVVTMAQDFAVKTIQVVDMQKVLDESKIGKVGLEKVKSAITASEKAINPKKTEVENEKKNLEKQAASLSEAAFKEKQNSLVAKNQQLKVLVAKEQEKIAKLRAEIMGDIIKKARTAVEDLSKQNGYSLVVEKGAPGILYSGGMNDITEIVIEKIGG
jgi:outer membrane protein